MTSRMPPAAHATEFSARLTDPIVLTPKLPRLIFLVTHSSPGGVQELWANLAAQFRDHGFETQLVALYPPEVDALQPSDSARYEYIVPQRPRSLLARIRLFLALRGYLRGNGPTLVVTAMPAANVITAAAVRFIKGNVGVIMSHHTPVGTYNKALNFVDGFVGSWKGVKSIVTVSDAVRDSLLNKSAVYLSKQQTVHNALHPDIESYLATLQAARDRSVAAGRRVFATGRLAAQKNYALLIRTAARLPDVEFSVIGAGEDEVALKTLASELDVSKRVHFLGYHPRLDTLKMISDADIFVQPSRFEGHSLALIEAAKLGLPLIVSNIPVQIEGTTAEDGTACAITVDPNDDESFAFEIARLLDDPDYYRLWAARSSKLAAEITWARMVNAYDQIFKTSE